MNLRCLRRRLGLALATTCALLALPSAASAAIVAYVDGGEVWASSLDGAKKVRVSGGEGYWEVAAVADNGRIAAAGRQDRTKSAALTRFKVWEPNGTVFNEGTLGKRGTWQLYAYPLSFDLTGDGTSMVYGYSNSTYGFPVGSYETGHYVQPVNFTGIGDQYSQTGQEWPTTFGRRVISRSGSTINVQQADGAPFQPAFDGWLTTTPGTDTTITRTDIAATGTVSSIEYETRPSGSGTVSERWADLAPIAGVGGAYDGQAGCRLSGAGLVYDVSWAQDATKLAWKDTGGVKVAGAPDFSGVNECALTSAPVTISATGSSPSIGGGSVEALTPAPPPPPPPPPPPAGGTTGGTSGGTSGGTTGGTSGGTTGGTSGGTTGGTSGGTTTGGTGPLATASRLDVTAPAKLAVAGLATPSGAALKTTVPAAGAVSVKLTVPAAKLGLRGRPVVVATGAGRALRAGALTVRLKLTKVGRARRAKLRRSKATITITQGTRRATRTTTLG